MGDVLTVLPFSNILVTIELTGAELLSILEHGISQYPEPVGQHIQVSGISFAFDPNAEPGGRVKQLIMADGGGFDLNKTYTVATIEFLAAGGDGYASMLEDGRSIIYYGSDAEALVEYIKTAPVIQNEAEGRVSVFTDETGNNSNTILWLSIGGTVLLVATGIFFVIKYKIKGNVM